MIVLAAGKGTRMHSSLAKVLHPLAGRALLTHVLDVATSLAPQHLIVIVGHQAEMVRQVCEPLASPVCCKSPSSAPGMPWRRQSQSRRFSGRCPGALWRCAPAPVHHVAHLVGRASASAGHGDNRDGMSWTIRQDTGVFCATRLDGSRALWKSVMPRRPKRRCARLIVGCTVCRPLFFSLPCGVSDAITPRGNSISPMSWLSQWLSSTVWRMSLWPMLRRSWASTPTPNWRISKRCCGNDSKAECCARQLSCHTGRAN